MDQERTYRWVQDRIRDLQSGKLSEADRIRLGELAKEDAFINDALEGYMLSAHHDHAPRLQTISHRIKNRNEAKRRRLLPSRRYWMVQAVAASLLLVLVTWAVIYYIGKNDQTVFVAADADDTVLRNETYENVTPPEVSGKDIAAEESATVEMTEESPGLRANAQAKAKEYVKSESAEKVDDNNIAANDTYAKENEEHTVSESVLSAPAAGATLSQSSGKDQRLESMEGDKPATTDVIPSEAKRDDGLYANQMDPSVMSRRVTGQVIDAYGQPVTGAFLAVANSNLITTSNQYGRFEIFIPQKTSAIEITSTGYADTLLNMSQGQEDVVVMMNPLRSGELPVLNKTYDLQSKQQAAISTNAATTSFTAYLKLNSSYPVTDQFTSGSKRVTVEFIINDRGRPEKIHVSNTTAGRDYVLEVERLLKNGPAWKCDDGKYPCRKEYSIYFQ